MRSRRQLEAIQLEVRRLRREVAKQRGKESSSARRAARALTPAQYEAELAELAAQLETIRNSESYRLGHALVRAARWPLRLIRPRSRRRPAARPSRRRGPREDGSRPRGPGLFPLPAAEPAVGPLAERTQTTLFLALGLSPEELRRVVEEVARLQAMLRDFRPVFVTDGAHWSAFRDHGYWFEHVVSEEEWNRHEGPGQWSHYVAERITSINATYAPDAVVVFHPGSGDEILRSGALNSIVGRPVAPVEERVVAKGRPAK